MDEIRQLDKRSWPKALADAPHPPERLFIRGSNPFTDQTTLAHTYICIVGARKHSSYGKEACEHIVKGLRGLPITIVSGLAMGIDTIAHQSALEQGLRTIAFPGSGLHEDVLYPRHNIGLARDIVDAGGALISEFEPNFVSTVWAFPQRNRLMAALCDLVIVIEATKKSGSLITARLALDYNKTVCAVPGSIFSQKSDGPHYLIKQGAIPITSGEDVLDTLGLKSEVEGHRQDSLFSNLSKEQLAIVDALASPLSKSELIETLGWPAYKVQILLMELEIQGITKETYGLVRLMR